MTKRSLAKDFHRLLKKIGRLTDGQASIENVDWDNGDLNSFTVVICPNASFYKGGRFKFSVQIPEDFTSEESEEVPGIWCETDIYHPNIDRHEEKTGRFQSNVCLNVFSHGTWHHTYGLEGVVLGILFLMHNPNVDDPLSPEFDGGRLDIGEFADNVKDYMAGKEVEGNTYSIDFRVIDGEFKDLTLIENNAEVNKDNFGDSMNKLKESSDNDLVSEDDGNSECNTVKVDDQNGEKVNGEINVIDTICNTSVIDKDTEDINKANEGFTDSDIDDEIDVMPVRFIVDDECADSFVIAFGDDGDHIVTANPGFNQAGLDCDKEKLECDKCNRDCDRNKLECDSDIYAENSTIRVDGSVTEDATVAVDKDSTENCAISNDVMFSTNSSDNGGLSKSRRTSLQNEGQAKTTTRFKTSFSIDDMNIKTLLCVALECILTFYRNTL